MSTDTAEINANNAVGLPYTLSIWHNLPSFRHSGLAHERLGYVSLRMSSRKQYTGRAFPMSECASEKEYKISQGTCDPVMVF